MRLFLTSFIIFPLLGSVGFAQDQFSEFDLIGMQTFESEGFDYIGLTPSAIDNIEFDYYFDENLRLGNVIESNIFGNLSHTDRLNYFDQIYQNQVLLSADSNNSLAQFGPPQSFIEIFKSGESEGGIGILKSLNETIEYPSTTLIQFQNASKSEQELFLERILTGDTAATQIYRGDILRDSGKIEEAYKLYIQNGSADPYAIAQSSILLLQNPNLMPNTTAAEASEKAWRGIEFAAEYGDSAALTQLSLRESDLNTKYELAIQAREQDPLGIHSDQINRIIGDICEAGESACEPVPVWYITNRQYLEGNTDGFGSTLLPDKLHVGIVETMVRSSYDPNQEERSSLGYSYCTVRGRKCLGEDGEVIVEVGQPRIANIDNNLEDFLTSLKSAADEKGTQRVVVYIHGFNNTFNVAAQRLALITNRGRVNAIPIVLSWASAGNAAISFDDESRMVQAYRYDQIRASESCKKFSEALSAIVKIFGGENVHILAHSMGSDLLRQILFGCDGGSDSFDSTLDSEMSVKNIILAAATLQ